MKTKKMRLICAALTAVLFTITLLITSCLEPLAPFSFEKNQGVEFQPEPGKTYVKFNFGGAGETNARTIFPDVTAIAGFKTFIVTVYEEEGTNAGYQDLEDTQVDQITITSQTQLTAFDPGFYYFRVDAYQKAGATVSDVIAATGWSNRTDAEELEEFTVTTIDIDDLEAVGTAGGGQGSLVYDFKFGTKDLETVTMGIYSGTTVIATEPINVITGTPDTAAGTVSNINAGYYRVVVTMEKDGFKTAQWMESLHVYAGMSSTADRTLPALKSNVYTVTLQYTDNRAAGSKTVSLGGAAHGDPLSSLFTGGNAVHQTPNYVPAATEVKVFTGWYLSYTAPDTYTNKFDSADIILKDGIVLYSGWAEGTSFNFNITYNSNIGGVNPLLGHLLTPDGEAYAQDDLSPTLSFGVDTSAGGAAYTNIRWYTEDDLVNAAETGDEFDFTFTNGTNHVGIYRIYVFAELGGELFDACIEISVSAP